MQFALLLHSLQIPSAFGTWNVPFAHKRCGIALQFLLKIKGLIIYILLLLFGFDCSMKQVRGISVSIDASSEASMIFNEYF
jgi:hypothetical protein